MEQFLKIKKFILLFFILKILMALVFFVIMEPVFGQSVFKFNDFGKYQNLNMKSGKLWLSLVDFIPWDYLIRTTFANISCYHNECIY